MLLLMLPENPANTTVGKDKKHAYALREVLWSRKHEPACFGMTNLLFLYVPCILNIKMIPEPEDIPYSGFCSSTAKLNSMMPLIVIILIVKSVHSPV